MEQDLVSRLKRSEAANTANLPGVDDLYSYVRRSKPSATLLTLVLYVQMHLAGVSPPGCAIMLTADHYEDGFKDRYSSQCYYIRAGHD